MINRRFSPKMIPSSFLYVHLFYSISNQECFILSSAAEENIFAHQFDVVHIIIVDAPTVQICFWFVWHHHSMGPNGFFLRLPVQPDFQSNTRYLIKDIRSLPMAFKRQSRSALFCAMIIFDEAFLSHQWNNNNRLMRSDVHPLMAISVWCLVVSISSKLSLLSALWHPHLMRPLAWCPLNRSWQTLCVLQLNQNGNGVTRSTLLSIISIRNESEALLWNS